MALDIDSFKEEEVSPAKLQKHIRELSEQLYRNVRLQADNHDYISSVVLLFLCTYIFIRARSTCVSIVDVFYCASNIYTAVYPVSC